MNPVDKLKSLLSEKTEVLRGKEEQLVRLQRSTQEMRAQIEGIQEALTAIQPEAAANGDGETGGKLTPSIINLIQSRGVAPGFTPTEIVEMLQGKGFNPDKRLLYASVYPVCLRLAKQGKIKEGTKHGSRSFMRNEPI